jgi:hypothetical protein
MGCKRHPRQQSLLIYRLRVRELELHNSLRPHLERTAWVHRVQVHPDIHHPTLPDQGERRCQRAITTRPLPRKLRTKTFQRR